MSAAEKLKALDGTITDLSPFAGAGGRFISELHVKEPAAQSLVALRNALPQIVAVVEAAENHVDEEWAAFAEFGEPEHGDMPPNTSVTNAKLAAALSALDQALGDA
jgi:hypothetical protein